MTEVISDYGSGNKFVLLHIEMKVKVGHPNGPMGWAAQESKELCESEAEAVIRRGWVGVKCHGSQVE